MRAYSLYNAVRLYIEERPPEEIANLKPGHLARRFNVSISFLSRTFSKYSFFTLQEYLEMYMFYHFHNIASDLKKPNVKEALEKMNIKDAGYFIRRYKRRYKATPGQYCKEWRERKKRYPRYFQKRSEEGDQK